MFNESTEKFEKAFCSFSAVKNIFATSSSSICPTKLTCSGILVFVCLGKSMPMGL